VNKVANECFIYCTCLKQNARTVLNIDLTQTEYILYTSVFTLIASIDGILQHWLGGLSGKARTVLAANP